MYAVIKTGGKQYRVEENALLRIERLPEARGAAVAFDQVLMIADDGGVSVGTPSLDGACVTATVLDLPRADKIIVFKKKRRQNYRRKRGHRQWLSLVRIDEILRDKTKARPRPAAVKAAEAGSAVEAAEAGSADQAAATGAAAIAAGAGAAESVTVAGKNKTPRSTESAAKTASASKPKASQAKTEKATTAKPRSGTAGVAKKPKT